MDSDSTAQIDALLARAIAAHRQGNLKLAAQGYEQVLSTNRDHAAATQLLGTIALQTQNYKKARTLLTRALELDPQNGTTFHNLARLDEAEGKLSDAASNYKRAVKLMPASADSSYSLANVLTSLGRLDESEQWYRETLRINPGYAAAYRQISRLVNHTEVDDDIRAMENLYATPGLDNASKLQLAFALGKAYEDLEQFDKAFDFFSEGNRLKRAGLRFDINRWDKEIDQVVSVFSPQLFRQFAGAGDRSAKPVFILGMPRSGTSLIEQILASHSKVFGGGELQALNLATMGAMNVSQFPANVPTLNEDVFSTIAEAYLEQTTSLSPESTCVTDKKPDNFKLIGIIKLAFPNAIVIHTCRDPLDNCLSLYKNHFSDNGPFYSYEQKELGQYYRGYSRLMEHWHSVLPGFIYDVQYESVVADVEAATRQLLNYCGLEFEKACLEFHRTRRTVRTASAIQVRQAINSRSVALSRRYESRLEPLIASLAGP